VSPAVPLEGATLAVALLSAEAVAQTRQLRAHFNPPEAITGAATGDPVSADAQPTQPHS